MSVRRDVICAAVLHAKLKVYLKTNQYYNDMEGRAARAGAETALQRRFEGVSGVESRACLGILHYWLAFKVDL